MGGKWEREVVWEERSANNSVGVRLSSVWQAISEHIGHFVWSPLPSDHQQGSSSRTYRQMEAVYVCEWDKKEMWYCLVFFPSVRFCLSILGESVYRPDEIGRVCLLSTHTHTHTSFVHACLQNPCQNANLNEPPCRLLCVNANMYISTFTAVSLFNSLSKGQTS